MYWPLNYNGDPVVNRLLGEVIIHIMSHTQAMIEPVSVGRRGYPTSLGTNVNIGDQIQCENTSRHRRFTRELELTIALVIESPVMYKYALVYKDLKRTHSIQPIFYYSQYGPTGTA
jgi:anti-sigma factor ChrR (cupin superfamily)